MKRRLQLMTLLFVTCVSNVIASEQTDAYGINPGDVLNIFVWNEEDLSQELLVAPDGSISVNMIGRLSVSGLSTPDVEQMITKGLNKYLRNEPLVTVSLASVEGNRVYVQGAVTRPGAYVASSKLDVMQVLALAGGFDPYAQTSEVKVVRRSPTGEQQLFLFDYDRFKDGKDLDTNLVLEPGDVVIVP